MVWVFVWCGVCGVVVACCGVVLCGVVWCCVVLCGCCCVVVVLCGMLFFNAWGLGVCLVCGLWGTRHVYIRTASRVYIRNIPVCV